MKTEVTIGLGEKRNILFECEGIPNYQVFRLYKDDKWIVTFHLASYDAGETFSIFFPNADVRLDKGIEKDE